MIMPAGKGKALPAIKDAARPGTRGDMDCPTGGAWWLFAKRAVKGPLGLRKLIAVDDKLHIGLP